MKLSSTVKLGLMSIRMPLDVVQFEEARPGSDGIEEVDLSGVEEAFESESVDEESVAADEELAVRWLTSGATAGVNQE